MSDLEEIAENEEAQSEANTNRQIKLKIAYHAIIGVLVLLAASIVVIYCLPNDVDWKRELLSIIIGGLFSVFTLIMGYIAGSNIDN